MIETKLDKFIEHVSVYDDKYLLYEDDNNYMLIPKESLISSMSYQECDDKMYSQLLFNGSIDKGMNFKTTKIKRPVPKSEITGKDEDKLTLVDKDIEVKQMWLITNGMKVSNIFNNKDEAKELLDRVNQLAL